MLWDAAAVLFLLAAAGQISYLSLLGGQMSGTGKVVVPDDFESISQKAVLPVSVIICARNEASKLQQNLGSILTQDYVKGGKPLFEIIVVNDCSEDDTAAVLENFARSHGHLRIVTITGAADRNLPGKKFALSRGVAAAAHNYLLLTDADCSAGSNHWIRRMASPFLAGKEIVAGYGAFREEPGLLNRFIRCETVFTFLQLHGMALLEMPYMAVGRNLAVKKELLAAAQQNELWKKTPSGDDDLLIRLCATTKNFIANTHPESFTYSAAKAGLQDYIRQKERHLSTGKYYRPAIKFWLGLNGLCHTLFWCMLPLLIVGMAFQQQSLVPGAVLLLLLILRSALFYQHMVIWSDRLQEKRLSLFLPVFDFLLAAYNILFSPYILWKNKQRWR